MKRILICAVAAILSATTWFETQSVYAFSLDAAPLVAEDLAQHDGVVVSAQGGKLTMTGENNSQHSHDIGPGVKITVNGKSGQLEDLKKGMRIRVTTDKDGKVLAVSTFDSHKQT